MPDSAGDRVAVDELDEADEIEDAVFSALDRPLVTVALVGTMLCIHLWIGAIVWLSSPASRRPSRCAPRWRWPQAP